MKRARPGKSKGKQAASGDGELGFEEARELQSVIASGGRLSDSELLRVLKADKPCETLYSKACKASQGPPLAAAQVLPPAAAAGGSCCLHACLPSCLCL
jgi:hypothetical protein